MNNNDLISFEKEIQRLYNSGEIKAPIHLSNGSEEQLIEIFKQIKDRDWVFSSYRNHYHALLKGMPSEVLKQIILEGRSMHVMSERYKIYSSSIVCGQIPAALGAALAIKLKKGDRHVFAFCGDMGSEMGVFHECVKYANGHDLPITFIIEDNGLGVYTETSKVWGLRTRQNLETTIKNPKVIKYNYNRQCPHHGSGVWVDFPVESPKDAPYKEETTKSMGFLGKDSRTIFIGQTVGVKGSPIYSTLEGVPIEKRIELPIMEEVQMGMSIGLALEGYIPVSIYPRFDFLTLATNQLVNHLDKIHELSNGEFNPKIIIRTMVGSRDPLNGGPQHTQDHTEAYKLMLTNVDVRRLEHSSQIANNYEKALNSNKSSLVIELSELYAY